MRGGADTEQHSLGDCGETVQHRHCLVSREEGKLDQLPCKRLTHTECLGTTNQSTVGVGVGDTHTLLLTEAWLN